MLREMIMQNSELALAVLGLLTTLLGVLSAFLVWMQYRQQERNKIRDKELETIRNDRDRDKEDHQRELTQLQNNNQIQEKFFEVIVADRQESAERDKRHIAVMNRLSEAVENSASIDAGVKTSIDTFASRLKELSAKADAIHTSTEEAGQRSTRAEEEYQKLKQKIDEYIKKVQVVFEDIQKEIADTLETSSKSQTQRLDRILKEYQDTRTVIEESMKTIENIRVKTKPLPDMSADSEENNIVKENSHGSMEAN